MFALASFRSVLCSFQWMLNHMAEDDWWPVQILVKCPSHTVRQVQKHLCDVLGCMVDRSHFSRFEKCLGDSLY